MGIFLLFILTTPFTSYACSPVAGGNYPTTQSVIDEDGTVLVVKVLHSGTIVVAEVLESTSNDTPDYIIMRAGDTSCATQFSFTVNTYATVVTPSENITIINHSDLDSQFSYFYSTQSAAYLAYTAIQNGENPQPEITIQQMGYVPAGYTLSPGMNNTDVAQLQTALTRLGYGLVADGVYGNGTRQAVSRFQSGYKLTVDGIAGTKTQSLLQQLSTQPVAMPSNI